MELLPMHEYADPTTQTETASSKFIEANTQAVTLDEIREKHLIPVFIKENQPTISQAEFIQNALELVEEVSGKRTANLSIRVSHPIKGRIFEARNKKAEDLEDWEKTIYYERMAFIAELPDYTEIINGQELAMTIGGVKAYNQDNLYSNSNCLQKFRFFTGFKVKVCTNLCIWTDGYSGELKVRNLQDLINGMYDIINRYRADRHRKMLEQWNELELSEHEFAQLMGKARLYQFLPKYKQKEIPELLLPDSQISTIARTYYQDRNFGSSPDGSITLWKLYNLLTDAVKSSYIDTFLDRNVNTHQFVSRLADAMEGGQYHWFLN